MTMRRLLFAVLAALIVSAASAAPPSDTAATLKIYQRTNQSIVAVTEAAIKRFNASYPKVKVEMQWQPLGSWGEYISGFLNQAAAGNAPDIYEVAIEGFSAVASKGLFVPLDELIARDPAAKKLLADIDPNLLAGMSYGTGGKLYFFPTSWNSVVVFYNKDLFDQAGVAYPNAEWTWDDFLKAAKALTKRGADGRPTQYGYFVPGYNFGLTPWLLTNDTDKLKNHWHESNVKDPRFRESLQFLHDLIHVHRVAPGFEKGVGDAQFAARQVAMFSAGHWPVPTLLASGMKNVGVQTMPAKLRKTTVFGVGGLGITRSSRNPELAWELIKELTGPVAQKMYADTGRNVPALRSAAADAGFLKFPGNARLFYASAASAIPIASPSNFSEVEDIFMRNVDLYLTDNAKLDEMLERLDAELTRAMRRAR
jgi:multiple sugar transport system substrate-binding protein